jgi:hypothetical protein
MLCLGMSTAFPRGRGDRAPPRKNRPPHRPRLFPREAILARITNPAEGRAPHARKEGTGLTVAYPRWAAARSPTHRVGMKCLGIRTALPRGRTECVPPRKPPPRNLRVSPVRPCVLGSPPAEGRAPHAHNEGIGFARACPPWALGSSITPGDHDTPRFAAGLTTRTHRVRPSDKTAVRVISGLFPARPSHPG